MTKLCDQCHKPLVKGVNCLTAYARRCCLLNTKELSPCQKAKNIESSKATRKRYNASLRECKLPELDKSRQAMRECLKCDSDENGIVKKFLSLSPGNRVCPECANHKEGFKVSAIDTAGIKGSNSDYMDPIEAAWMPDNLYYNTTKI